MDVPELDVPGRLEQLNAWAVAVKEAADAQATQAARAAAAARPEEAYGAARERLEALSQELDDVPRKTKYAGAWRAKLKGSIGEGPNHSNFSDQSSVKTLSEVRKFWEEV